MQGSFLAELALRRPAIKQAWERRLRKEPITSPLANPDTLVLLMDRTLDELQRALASLQPLPPPQAAPRPIRSGCLCGLNPLLAYFRVAASVLPAQMCIGADRCPDLSAGDYAICMQEMLGQLQVIASEEIRAFCAMCQTEIAQGGRHGGAAAVGQSLAATFAK